MRLWTVTVVLVVAAGVQAWLVVRNSPAYSAMGDAGLLTALHLSAGGVVLVAAVIFRKASEPGGRRLGFVAVALAWFLAAWDNPGAGAAGVFTTGLLFGAVCPVVVAQVAMDWSGRDVRRAPTRWVIAFGYLGALGFTGLVPALLSDPVADGCNLCPANLLFVADVPDVAAFSGRLGVWVGAVWAPAVVGALVLQLRRSSPSSRRAAAGVVAPAVGYLLVVGVERWAAAARGHAGSGLLDQRLTLAEAVLVVGEVKPCRLS